MKKMLLILLLVGVSVGVGYAVMTGMTPLYQSDAHKVRDLTYRFFECVKFKEFDEASALHDAADMDKADIPKMIEDLFKIPPEQLDIQDINVLFADIDSTGKLGKVKTRFIVHVLNTDKIKKPEVVLYWKKQNGKWYLKLRSTLERKPKAMP